jgi:hypothetical protein
MSNANKSQGFRMGQKRKNITNKGLATKPTQGQFNIMEARFAQLEVLVTSMATPSEI